MKVICDRGALVEALNVVGGVVVTRTPKPVLACVKLTAEGSTLTLAATDMEVGITLATARVEVQQAGSALVPADKLSAIVRESIDPTLTIHVEQDQATITGQDSKFKIFGYQVADFPPVSEFKGDADFEVSANDLHRLIALTIFATARENSRYAINGVLVERDGNKLTVVATDGHRLAMAKGACKAPKSEGKPTTAIVPTKALHLLQRLFNDGEETVRVKIENSQILFATDAATLASNLVEGNFPPYKDVVPKDGDRKAMLNTDTLVSAFRRAALLTNEESKGVKMSFSKDGLTLTSRAPEMGEAEINVELPEYSGEPIEIGFNPVYMLDALKVIEEDKVNFEFKAGNKPGVLKTAGNFLYVVMPVNLQ
jgi:DNA polymerase-3 subunit beta